MTAGPTAILVTTYTGQASFAELERLAETGKRPRREYVRLAEEFDHPVVVDAAYLGEHGHWLARRFARLNLPLAQIAEAFLRRRRYGHVVALSDRIGLPLALLYKLTRSRRDLVLVADWLTPPKKAVFLRRFKVHSHIKAIVQTDPLQQRKARDCLGVDAAKLVLLPWSVDTRFWRPEERGDGAVVCAVGWEQRDYATLIEAVRDLPVEVCLAVGTMVFSPPDVAGGAGAGSDGSVRRITLDRFAALRRTRGYRVHARWLAGNGRPLPDNVRVFTQLDPLELRDLYARSRFVVLPLHDVDYDVGATAVTEAMAMGKAVVLSAIAGQTAYVRDGEDGLYVPPADPGALREAICFMLDHPEEVHAMGRAARERAEADFSVDEFARRLRTITTG